MGLFSAIKQRFYEGRKRAHAEGKARKNRDLPRVVKLVEPNYGRIVTFRIFADEPVLHMYIELIVLYAKQLKVKATVSGKKITLDCPDVSTAKIVRETWE